MKNGQPPTTESLSLASASTALVRPTDLARRGLAMVPSLHERRLSFPAERYCWPDPNRWAHDYLARVLPDSPIPSLGPEYPFMELGFGEILGVPISKGFRQCELPLLSAGDVLPERLTLLAPAVGEVMLPGDLEVTLLVRALAPAHEIDSADERTARQAIQFFVDAINGLDPWSLNGLAISCSYPSYFDVYRKHVEMAVRQDFASGRLQRGDVQMMVSKVFDVQAMWPHLPRDTEPWQSESWGVLAAGLRRMLSLRYVTLCEEAVDAGLVSSLTAAPLLETVSLSSWNDDCLADVAKLPRLRSLSWTRYSPFDGRIREEAMRQLGLLPALEALNLDVCFSRHDDRWLRSLEHFPALRSLTIAAHDVDSEGSSEKAGLVESGCESAICAIAQSRSLEELVLLGSSTLSSGAQGELATLGYRTEGSDVPKGEACTIRISRSVSV